jgi:hypothetical protein
VKGPLSRKRNMRIKTDTVGNWRYITDDESTVIIGDIYNYYLIGRAINNGDRFSISVDQFGGVNKSRTHVQAQMIRLFNGTQKKTLTVEGFV